METDPIKEENYLRAKKRVEAIKKFYKHLVIYIAVNSIISFIKIRNYMDDGNSIEEILSFLDIYVVWIIWGFFLLLQALRTFRPSIFMGADWEERKIKEYMNDK